MEGMREANNKLYTAAFNDAHSNSKLFIEEPDCVKRYKTLKVSF